MDLTGSIADATAPLSADIYGSVAANATGSSAIDTIVQTIVELPGLVLSVAAMAGADIGSTLGM